MTDTTHDPIEAAPTDDAVTPELDGQSTTVEEAMDAATDEEGFAAESAYTTQAGKTSVTRPPEAGSPGAS
jgi:hypothetical protein